MIGLGLHLGLEYYLHVHYYEYVNMLHCVVEGSNGKRKGNPGIRFDEAE